MNKIHIRPYTTNDYISVRRNMEEGGLYYPEIDAEQKLNEKITRNPESILVAELNGAVIGGVFIVEDGWAPFFFRLAVPRITAARGLQVDYLKRLSACLPKKGIKKCIALLMITILS